jgi:hypothetical protein
VKRFAGLAAIVVALSAATATARTGERFAAAPAAPLVGIVGNQVFGHLARFDPVTLQPGPRRVGLGDYQAGWSFSPDRRELVLGNDNESCVGGATGLRFIDLTHMQALGDVRLVADGPVEATAWPDPTHVLAVVAVNDCLTTKQTVVFSIDVASRRVVAETPLPGDLLGSALVHGKLVLLLAPHGRVGPARIATVDALGRLHETVLAQIDAGRVFPSATSSTSLTKLNMPALAVDAGNGTAYVLPAGDRLAAVDLQTMRVSYHNLSEKTSVFSRLLRWLDPAAQAKGDDGPTREAVWLGNGQVAVTGQDSTETGGTYYRWSTTVSPAGLRIINTRDWTFHTVNPAISQVQLEGGQLLATGQTYSSNHNSSHSTFTGLIAYSLDGHERYRLFNGTEVDKIAAVGPRGYAAIPGAHGTEPTASFNLTTGTLGPSYETSLYELLLPERAPTELNY